VIKPQAFSDYQVNIAKQFYLNMALYTKSCKYVWTVP